MRVPVGLFPHERIAKSRKGVSIFTFFGQGTVNKLGMAFGAVHDKITCPFPVWIPELFVTLVTTLGSK